MYLENTFEIYIRQIVKKNKEIQAVGKKRCNNNIIIPNEISY